MECFGIGKKINDYKETDMQYPSKVVPGVVIQSLTSVRRKVVLILSYIVTSEESHARLFGKFPTTLM